MTTVGNATTTKAASSNKSCVLVNHASIAIPGGPCSGGADFIERDCAEWPNAAQEKFSSSRTHNEFLHAAGGPNQHASCD